MKARGDADAVDDEESVSRWLVVKNGTVFDMQACVAGRYVSTTYEHHSDVSLSKPEFQVRD